MGEVIAGHVLDVLASLPAESVSCVITSPPYWSLRKYDAPDVVWGGDAECAHQWGDVAKGGAAVEGYAGKKKWQHSVNGRDEPHPEARHRLDNPEDWTRITRETSLCTRCGAWRGQYGLEPTPELYVEHSLMVLRAIRRVLRPDGCVWWNIGDGYAASRSYQVDGTKQTPGSQQGLSLAVPPGLKPKDLILMPERVALAAQADGWWVRSRIIWHKPNAMPESVRDRPTNAHETIWMLTKSARYWWDADAVREAHQANSIERARYGWAGVTEDGSDGKRGGGSFQRMASGEAKADVMLHASGRNVRDVWTFPTAQTPEAHFATFPIALPLRCIAAACPREVCATCGNARERIVETHRDGKDWNANNRAGGDRLKVGQSASDSMPNDYQPPTTIGWSDCGHDDYQPGVVLDPFAGLATTGLAALRLGRRFIGIELSEKYAELARRKLQRWWEDTRLVEADVPEPQMVLEL